jgi:hypothetical protein
MDVLVWLRSLGLERYEAAFRENEINERVLPSLAAEDLKELGVTALGHRRILLDAIAALRADTGGKTPPADLPSTPSATSVSPEDRAERRQVTAASVVLSALSAIASALPF